MRDPDVHWHRALYLVILAEFVAIVGLFSAMTNEYLSNAFMQTWASTNAPYIGLLLAGPFDIVLVGITFGLGALIVYQSYELPNRVVKKYIIERLHHPTEKEMAAE